MCPLSTERQKGYLNLCIFQDMMLVIEYYFVIGYLQLSQDYFRKVLNF